MSRWGIPGARPSGEESTERERRARDACSEFQAELQNMRLPGDDFALAELAELKRKEDEARAEQRKWAAEYAAYEAERLSVPGRVRGFRRRLGERLNRLACWIAGDPYL